MSRSSSMLGTEAFSNNRFLKSVIIEEGTIEIGNSCFYCCVSLESVVMADSVEYINTAAFSSCDKLETFKLSDNIISFGNAMFSDESPFYKNLTGDESNWDNGGLYLDYILLKVNEDTGGEFVVRDGTGVIAFFAFDDCEKIESVILPESVYALGLRAFSGCKSLAKFENKGTLYLVGVNAFNDTPLYNDESNWDNGILYINDIMVIVKEKYANRGRYTIKEGTKTIAANAFYYCGLLTEVHLPKSIVAIGEGAFRLRTSLKKVYYGGSYTDYYFRVFVDKYNEPLNDAKFYFGKPSALLFTDLPDGAYYNLPVFWAVENGISTGTSDTTFSPDAGCTRGQVVTFLWRAASEPEPTIDTNPFKDVKADSYYYKAVLWAVEQGITDGMDSTHFGPDKVCTRGQIATFIWRANGKPEAKDITNPFKDVKTGDYFYDAVLWAVLNGITNGTGADKFSPSNVCNRGQVVTFLYRNFAE